MHIPDGFVNGPVNGMALAISVGFCGYASRRLKREIDERQIPLIGVTAAFIFAAQMLNFPIAAGTSGHFLGAAFTSIILGPWAASLVMALVLMIQALGFADGGITALGSNIFNMGIVSVLVAYFAYNWLAKLLPPKRGFIMLSAAVAAWLSVVSGASMVALELAVSGTSPIVVVLPAMAGIYSIIGVGEALITVAILGTLLASRRDLVPQARRMYQE